MKVAKTYFDVDALRRVLNLSDKVEITSIYTTPDPPCVWVMLRSDDFEDVHPHSEAPILSREALDSGPGTD